MYGYKHSCAMYWDCIAYDKHSCAMYRDCIAYDKHRCAMLEKNQQCIRIELLMISIVMQCNRNM